MTVSRFSREQRKAAIATKSPLVRIVVDGMHLGDDSACDVSGAAPAFVADRLRDLIREWREASDAVQGRKTIH